MKSTCLKPLNTLQEVIEIYGKHASEKQEIVNCMRYAMIHRFALNVVIFFESLETYVTQYQGIDLFMPSAKRLVRKSVKTRILSETEGAACLDMLDVYRRARRAYTEKRAMAVAEKIPDFYIVMQTIVNRLEMTC